MARKKKLCNVPTNLWDRRWILHTQDYITDNVKCVHSALTKHTNSLAQSLHIKQNNIHPGISKTGACPFIIVCVHLGWHVDCIHVHVYSSNSWHGFLNTALYNFSSSQSRWLVVCKYVHCCISKRTSVECIEQTFTAALCIHKPYPRTVALAPIETPCCAANHGIGLSTNL